MTFFALSWALLMQGSWCKRLTAAKMWRRRRSLLCLCLLLHVAGLIPVTRGQFFTPLLTEKVQTHEVGPRKLKLAHVFTRSEINEVSGNLVPTHTNDEFHFHEDGHYITLGSTSARNIHDQNLEWELIKIARNKIADEATDWLSLRDRDRAVLDNMNSPRRKAAVRRLLGRAWRDENRKNATNIKHKLDIIRELYPRLFISSSNLAMERRTVLPGSDGSLLQMLLLDFDQMESGVPETAKTRPTEPQTGVEWSYDDADPAGPSNWPRYFAACGGSRQSPINIVSRRVRERKFPPLIFRNLKVFQQNVTVQHNGHTAQVVLHDGVKNISISGGNLPGEEYVLEQFHFHWGDPATPGSEHELNGERYPGEMHMVFLNKAYNSEQEATQHADGIAVLAFFLDEQPSDNWELGEFFEALQFIKRPKSLTFLTQPIDFLGFLAESLQGSFYRYAGSLTTPGCFEAVTWTIFEEPIGLSTRQLWDFGILQQELHPKQPLLDNFRPPQPLNGRIVYKSRVYH